MKETKIFVLGASGMLGRYVSKYLQSIGWYIIEIGRKELDANTVTNLATTILACESIGIEKGDIVINCIGTIKPMVDKLGDFNAIQVNSIFPRLLAKYCELIEAEMIHPTTDCVYTGNKGSYDENDKYDVGDVYGMSKALGEPNNCSVIRTSIIGEEVGQGRSLVEWVKSSADSTIFGYTNHYWNGITCLEFAKICDHIIEEGLMWKGTRHIHSNVLNKKELVQTISDVYDLNITVTPKEVEIPCDRSMSTIPENKEFLDSLEIPSLEEQIKEMKEFSKTLYGD